MYGKKFGSQVKKFEDHCPMESQLYGSQVILVTQQILIFYFHSYHIVSYFVNINICDKKLTCLEKYNNLFT